MVSVRLRIGVLGLGAVVQSVHLPLLLRRWAEFQVVAVADLSADRAAQVADRYGIEGMFTSTAELLAAHGDGTCPLDAVLVATSGTHGADSLAVAEAGLPVFCEKPLALAEAEIDRLEAAGARVQLGYMKEYDPATAELARVLDGTRVRAVTVEILHPSAERQLRFANLLPPPTDVGADRLAAATGPTQAALDTAVGTGTAQQWRDLYANVVLGSIVHDLSLLRHLGYAVAEVQTAHQWAAEGGHPGSVEAGGTLTGGARWQLGWHYLPDYPDYRETVTFHHDTGSASLTFGVPYLLNAATVLTVVTAADDGEVRAEYRWPQQEAFENELLAFSAFVRTGAAPHSQTAQGRADLVVAQQIVARLTGGAVAGEAVRR
ncbi:Gfo/Idh/MocA family protein [Ruania zhangjianzhongii]|uniref:Gfo/Idh/MocA family protein n=1 Tax=Ruania zhangjianzhongii TaxID=2603206 RepID=UPI0011C87664|nr:Gfo/Idh/MocA family oxidoreductase [Ruania zhangjianzhongii]